MREHSAIRTIKTIITWMNRKVAMLKEGSHALEWTQDGSIDMSLVDAHNLQ